MPAQPEAPTFTASPGLTSAQRIKLAPELLSTKEEGQAKAELEAALADASLGSKRRAEATKYLRQIKETPDAFFTDTFGPQRMTYVVKPGDELGKIAERCLKDPQLFYALARFNQIEDLNRLTPGALLVLPVASCKSASASLPTKPQTSEPEDGEKSSPAIPTNAQTETTDPLEQLRTQIAAGKGAAAADATICRAPPPGARTLCMSALDMAAQSSAGTVATGYRLRRAKLMDKSSPDARLRVFKYAMQLDNGHPDVAALQTDARVALSADVAAWDEAGRSAFARRDCSGVQSNFEKVVAVNPNQQPATGWLQTCREKSTP
jgi:hypothetical protein